MRSHIRSIMLIAGLFLTPSLAWAQGSYTYEVPPADFTAFFSHPRYEEGGFYTGIDFLYWKTNRPLGDQLVGVRGFLDFDGSLSGTPGNFIGDRQPALTTGQVSGTGVWQPGYNVFLGWRFQSGISLELGWQHLQQANYQASASLISPQVNLGNKLQNTFLYAPVTNFNNNWAGNDINVQGGDVGSTFGIWNGASIMSEAYTQSIDIYQIKIRVPIWDTDSYRNYGFIGPRLVSLQDKYAWTTVDQDLTGASTPDTIATYSNTVTNNMYGIFAGFGNEWYLGSTPAGAFAISLDLEASLYANLAKVEINWDRGDGLVSQGRVRNMSSIVPGVAGKIGFWWYPTEAISLHVSYDVLTFFNTIGSPNPIDFNMGTMNPQIQNIFFRWVYGGSVGISFVF